MTRVETSRNVLPDAPPWAVIYNPWANRGRLGRQVQALRARMEALADIRWQATAAPGHGRELAAALAEQAVAGVVAMGGDGTVHEVANGLMDLPAEGRPALGVVPVGSGNDFAFACGLPGEPLAAFRRVIASRPQPLDVGLIEDGAGRRRHFVNTAGMLLDGAINQASQGGRYTRGFLRYLLPSLGSLLRHDHPTRLTMELDGQAAERELMLLCVANGPREGGGFLIAPDARHDDGALDLVMVRPLSRWRMLRLLPAVIHGRHISSPAVEVRRCRTLQFTADRAVPIHLDGELWAPTAAEVREVRVTLLPAALRVVGKQQGGAAPAERRKPEFEI